MRLFALALALALALPLLSNASKDTEAQLRAQLEQARAEQSSLRDQLANLQALAKERTVTQRSNVETRLTGDVREAQNENASEAQAAVIAARAQNNAQLYTTISGFLTLLAGFGWKAYTDSRDHRWSMDSRRLADSATQEHRERELSKIDDATAQAKAAYNEANTVNRKIESIGLQMKDHQPLEPERKP